ncbi:MAG: DUF3109 family protein [Flavobacteriales bacterium]|nr:DUF3109 family protein [Flavobacteriales bacterium]MDA7761739.1 DUF3109 family protein [Crocinitomicaceae bacterium]MDO7609516.1 DUF3109 family protein [Crocinitomicaceae bacterium]
MVEIDDKIVSTDLFSEKFVCDLSKCKGACCVKGNGGAPLTEKEVELIEDNLEQIKPFMSEKGIQTIKDEGVYYLDEEDAPATKLIDKKECCFVYFDNSNTAKCSIETAYKSGEIDFNKPQSCHLYPIRIKEFTEFTALNYEEWDICAPACSLGQSLKVPVYKFLQEPITRVFGSSFFDELSKIDLELKKREETD